MASAAPSDNALVYVGPVKRGRPSSYTEELAAEICERIANGETLTAICEDEHMPTRMTVTRWLMADLHDFQLRYARAREQQANVEAEQIREIADSAYEDYYIDWKEGPDGARVPFVVVDGESVKRAQLRIDARKWRAERLNRRVYGNSVKHEHELSTPEPLGPGRLPASLGFLDRSRGEDKD